jgi:hypothetical protein
MTLTQKYLSDLVASFLHPTVPEALHTAHGVELSGLSPQAQAPKAAGRMFTEGQEEIYRFFHVYQSISPAVFNLLKPAEALDFWRSDVGKTGAARYSHRNSSLN